MKVLVAGGGSGGHVTPVLAILEALHAKEPNLEVLFVCDKKFAPQTKIILQRSPVPITLKIVWAGKLRRYHGVPLWKQLLDIPTVLLNIRDVFLVLIGIGQSWRLLRRFQPAVVFGKGGFVCLPVGIAAHLTKIPLIIHDSDAHPGATNRILAKWAVAIATGSPLENYNYDRQKSHYVGIPVSKQFHATSNEAKQQLKQQLLTDASRRLVAVVGGGLGARPINQAMIHIAASVIKENGEIIHVTGAMHGDDVQKAVAAKLPEQLQQYYHTMPFVDADKMADILKAADVVVSRGGATAMAELTLLHKATILVPSPRLTGGQQLKNAKSLEEARAVMVVSDTKMQKQPALLGEAILHILQHKAVQQELEKRIAAFAKPAAAQEVAQLILDVGKK